MKVQGFTGFEVPLANAPTDSFLATGRVPKSKAFTEAHLAKSGLTASEMGARPITAFDGKWYSAGYRMHYPHHLTGEPQLREGMAVYYRDRYELTPAGVLDKRPKCLGPSREEVGDMSGMIYVPEETHALVRDTTWNRTIYVHEGEKKAKCWVKHTGTPCYAIGGCGMWNVPGDQRRVNKTMEEFLHVYKPERIVLVPDGDVSVKPKVAKAFGTFFSVLAEMGFDVRMVQLPYGRGLDGKIDDLIVGDWLGQDVVENIENCANVRGYRESHASLIAQFPLLTNPATENRVESVQVNDHNIRKLVELHPMFTSLKYNEDKAQMEYEGDVMTDPELQRTLADTQYRFDLGKLQQRMLGANMTSVAMLERTYSPWRTYLEAIEWDGTERLKTWMVDYCNAEPSDMCLEGGLKWLVGAVARILTPGCKVDYMLVTTGPQGIGKSSLPTILFGTEGVRDISSSQSVQDRITIMHRGQCANWEELDGMSQYEVTHLKQMITATHDAFRRRYVADDELRARDFVHYGSTNNRHFLPADHSGQRRYCIIECGQIDFKALEDARDQLWAEAMYLFNQGEVDYSQVEASKAQGLQYVKVSDDYADLLNRVRDDYYNTGPDKVGGGAFQALGQVKEFDEGDYFCCTLGMWRESTSLTKPGGRAGSDLNNALKSNGWVFKDQYKINGKKKSSVWCCPVGLLD